MSTCTFCDRDLEFRFDPKRTEAIGDCAVCGTFHDTLDVYTTCPVCEHSRPWRNGPQIVNLAVPAGVAERRALIDAWGLSDFDAGLGEQWVDVTDNQFGGLTPARIDEHERDMDALRAEFGDEVNVFDPESVRKARQTRRTDLSRWAVPITDQLATDEKWMASERLYLGTILSGRFSGWPFDVTSWVEDRADGKWLVMTAERVW